MFTIKRFLITIFSQSVIEKIVAFISLVLLGWILSDFLALFFITFLFAYIFLELGELLASKLSAWGNNGSKDTPHKIAAQYSTTNNMVTVLYVVFIGIVIFVFSNILPQILGEITRFLKSAPDITLQVQDFIQKIEDATNLKLGLDKLAAEIVNQGNLEKIGQTAIGYITNAGILLTKFLMALILSYIFIIERNRIGVFLEKIKEGNFSFFYDEWEIIARKVGAGFGLIFKAQSIIAFVNAILTSVGLISISLVHGGESFPYIFTLSLIVFIFGFIPVFGTFLSGVPILIIGYGYGSNPHDSLIIVGAILAMIAIVHAVEAYYLNPKIVSSYVHFPVFITFVILLVSEHFFGLVGLLIGVPLFSVLLGFIEDFDRYITEVKHKLHG
ncbi:AI-2E family transporter [Candidatus Gracilibacteria bacterium]|nr:AI-2E family transporter [Candidatus Gracilibacteria bacterium]